MSSVQNWNSVVLDDRLFDINDQVRRNRAALAQWVGPNYAGGLLSNNLPKWDGFIKLQPLYTELAQHPLLAAANARVLAASAGVDVAKSKYKPAVGFDLSYGERENDRLGNPRDNFVSAMVTLSVPLFTGNRQGKEVNAAEHNRYANLNDRDLLLRDLRRQLESNFFALGATSVSY